MSSSNRYSFPRAASKQGRSDSMSMNQSTPQGPEGKGCNKGIELYYIRLEGAAQHLEQGIPVFDGTVMTAYGEIKSTLTVGGSAYQLVRASLRQVTYRRKDLIHAPR